MSDYNKINITVCGNGFVVETETNETLVFTTSKRLQKWIDKNIAEMGQTKDFCNGLDNGSKKEPLEHTPLVFKSNIIDEIDQSIIDNIVEETIKNV